MKWDKKCDPKSSGGLGVKDIFMFNEGLLAKWKWDAFHHNEALWYKVVDSK